MLRLTKIAYRKDKGFALLLALFAVLILSTLTVDLAFNSSVSASIAGNYRDRLQAEYLAKAGIDFGMLQLEIDKLIDKIPNKSKTDDLTEIWWNLPMVIPDGLLLLTSASPEGALDPKAMEALMAQFDLGGNFEVVVTDESSKINLNAMRINNDAPNGIYFLLLNLFTLDEFKDYFKDKRSTEFVDNIVDWLDADGNRRGPYGGFEDDFYQTHEPPYKSKNGPFFSMDELRLVRDMDLKLLDKLSPYITVFPYQIAAVQQDFGNININTVPELIIASLFDQNYVVDPAKVAEQIMEQRNERPFKDVAEFEAYLDERLGIEKDKGIIKSIKDMLAVKSDVFRINSKSTVNETVVLAEVIVDRSGDKPEFYYWKVD